MILSETLRLARPDDTTELLEYFRAFHLESPYAQMPFDETKVRHLIQTAVSDPRQYLVLVSHDRDRPVGVLASVKTSPTFSSHPVAAELAWYITPDYRTLARSRETLLAYLAWSKAVGCTPQVSKLSTSPRSVDIMYKRMGFREVETSFIKD